MNRLFSAIIISFSLLFAPITHTHSMACEGDHCHASGQSEKQQDNDKMAKEAGHHCYHSHGYANVSSSVAAPEAVSSQTIFAFKDESVSSVVQWPPLRPPSHV